MSQMIQRKQTRIHLSKGRLILSVLLLALILWPQPKIAQAQWTGTTDIYNTNAGNVGIGTTTPEAKLSVHGYNSNAESVALSLYPAISGGIPAYGIGMGPTAAEGYLTYRSGTGNSGVFGHKFFVNNLEIMRLSGDGNVSIGTTGLEARLHIYGNGNQNGILSLQSSSVGSDGSIAFLGPYAYINSDAPGDSYWSWGHRYDGDANVWVRTYTGLPLVQTRLDRGGNFIVSTDTSTDSSPPSFTDRFIVTNNGNVGIGTTNPRGALDVNGRNAYIGAIPVALGYASTGYPGIGYNFEAQADGNWKYKVTDTAYMIGLGQSHRIDFNYAPLGTGGNQITWNTAMSIKNDGNIGIGTTAPDPASKLTVAGNVTVTGNIAAKYQDVAEWVPSSKAMPAGTVVVLDTAHTNQVLPAEQAYDTRVAGVVSDMPGLLLGEAGDGKVKVATTGRVKVKVDATKNPVRVGDLLVTSDKEGVAMKSEPMEINGRPFHQPGTILGKALEPLKEGEGEILVLLSMQ
jgi:hypothetical protein